MNIKFEEYLNTLADENLVKGKANIDEDLLSLKVKGITFDSTQVKADYIFICKGRGFKKEYLEDAVNRGAAAYIIEEDSKSKLAESKESVAASLRRDVGEVSVSNIAVAMSLLGNIFYDYPYEKVKIIGITGTKGKSTAAYFIKSILDADAENKNEKETGLISGIEIYDGIQRMEANLTTPESLEILRYLNNMVQAGIKYCTMEVSSQGLKYNRVRSMRFHLGMFLNLGYDHISPIEHADFNDYKQSKLKLMSMAENLVINMDSQYGEDFIKEGLKSPLSPSITTFSTLKGGKGDFTFDKKIYNKKENSHGQVFYFKERGLTFKQPIKLLLDGDFNISNAIGAVAVAKTLNISEETAVSALEKVRVPGRMETFFLPKSKVKVIIDYAHNKMSFEALFASVKKDYSKEQISIVFGCPGKKALDRRSDLAEVTAREAGLAIITEEDSGEESTGKISGEIYDNLCKFGGRGKIWEDRKEAIELAVERSHPGDIILITGKGRETTQKRGKTYVSYPSDVEIIKEIISRELR